MKYLKSKEILYSVKYNNPKLLQILRLKLLKSMYACLKIKCMLLIPRFFYKNGNFKLNVNILGLTT